jgi:hypothetical protein
MNNRKRKRQVIAQLHRELCIRRFWRNIEKREQEYHEIAMDALRELMPEFAPIFQSMPRMTGWSL